MLMRIVRRVSHCAHEVAAGPSGLETTISVRIGFGKTKVDRYHRNPESVVVAIGASVAVGGGRVVHVVVVVVVVVVVDECQAEVGGFDVAMDVTGTVYMVDGLYHVGGLSKTDGDGQPLVW